MPGRPFLTATPEGIAAHFGADVTGLGDAAARREMALGDEVAAVVSDGGRRRLQAMRWGMIPMGRVNARGRPVMETIVNARSETLFAKTAFAGLGRCILPVSGWYEWTGKARRKDRWAIADADGGLLAVAAVWDVWRAPGGPEVLSLATVTCPPNAEVAVVHDRMPALLAPDDWAVWLGETAGDAGTPLRTAADGTLVVSAAR